MLGRAAGGPEWSGPPTGACNPRSTHTPTQRAARSVVTTATRPNSHERHHRHLLRAVAQAVNAPPEPIDDACQTAWSTLLRCELARATVFSWLRAVAIHVAWRQDARTRTEIPAGTFGYREIMQITGASYSRVYRRLTEGRRALYKLGHERENACHAEPAEPDRDLAPRA
jgi:DNA-directed RNA polymerase specialized sigma24 family protein